MSLISTGDVRSWLGTADGDNGPNPRIAALIPAIDQFINNYTNRTIEGAFYKTDPLFSFLDGTGTNWIYVPHYPLSYVEAVYVDAEREWSNATLIASDDLVIDWNAGKIVSEAGRFTKGRRNVRIDFKAGFSADTSISTYPIPLDLKQVALEIVSESMRQGITMIHQIDAPENPRLIQLFTKNSMWKQTLDRYKDYSLRFQGLDE